MRRGVAEHFLNRIARQLERPRLRLTLANVQKLQGHDWPGNVRELQHAQERAGIVAADGRLRFDIPAVASTHRARPLEPNAVKPILTDAEVRAFEASNINRPGRVQRQRLWVQ